MMKLYVDQIEGDGVSGRAFAIYNEAGERLPCLTGASVHHNLDDAARIDISLVVDGKNIVFGKPPNVVYLEGETFSRKQVLGLIDAINQAVANGAKLNLNGDVPNPPPPPDDIDRKLR